MAHLTVESIVFCVVEMNSDVPNTTYVTASVSANMWWVENYKIFGITKGWQNMQIMLKKNRIGQGNKILYIE